MDSSAVEAVAAELVCRGQAIGAFCRVAALSPNVPGGHLFALLDHRGTAKVLAHDAFEAARWFLDIEDGAAPPKRVIKLPRDIDLSDADYDRREDQHRGGYTWMMIDVGRKRLATARAEFLGRLARRPTTE